MGHSRVITDDMSSESHLLGRLFLGYEEWVASIFYPDAAQIAANNVVGKTGDTYLWQASPWRRIMLYTCVSGT